MGYNRRVPRNRAARRRLEKSYRRRPAPRQGSNRTLFLVLGLFTLAVLIILALGAYNLR
ncbi:hypothetical protein [Rubrobacter marinus]|uniref:hypothetical protein n=1 Tax=Rubrobacter marinus TaxID=2653852 RepID=UPI00140E376E|nr:hypothetical protein [Rubrobacter marinus]